VNHNDFLLSILWNVHESFVLSAARIKAQHRLSVADAMIAAYSLQQNAVLMHKDPEYSPLIGLMHQENLPFK
jgi:predicted nucleic acid-binding protein